MEYEDDPYQYDYDNGTVIDSPEWSGYDEELLQYHLNQQIERDPYAQG